MLLPLLYRLFPFTGSVLPDSDLRTGLQSELNAVAMLDITISDPPTQSEVAAMLGKLNELIVALSRS